MAPGPFGFYRFVIVEVGQAFISGEWMSGWTIKELGENASALGCLRPLRRSCDFGRRAGVESEALDIDPIVIKSFAGRGVFGVLPAKYGGTAVQIEKCPVPILIP